MVSYLSIVSYVFVALFAVSCAFMLAAVSATRRFATRCTHATSVGESDRRPPVTILKPLHGLDFNLEDNLRSFCTQAYPEYQIVFGIQNPNDPALSVARSLQRDYPHLDIRIVVDDSAPFHNMKVNNLHNMLREAAHSRLVIADSDMVVGPDYLTAVTAPLADPGVGAVTCLYRGVAADGIAWSRLGAMHINFDFLPQALLGNRLGVGDGCFGATIALTRSTLERIGGFAAIGDHLADDHALGQAIKALGLRVELAPYLVDTVVHEPSFPALLAHELRWARTVFLCQAVGYAGAVLTHPLPLALLAALFLPLPFALGLVGTAVAVRWLVVYLQARAFGLAAPTPGKLVARDLLSFYVFVSSFFPQKLVWRSQKLKSRSNGIIVQQEKTA